MGIRKGVGTNVGSPFSTVLASAQRLQTINGMEPWVVIMQHSPRRWSYVIRFYRVGEPWRAEYFTGNGNKTPSPVPGGYHILPVCRPHEAGCAPGARRRRR